MRAKWLFIAIILISCEWSLALPIRAQLTKLNVTTTGVSPTSLAAFVAKETGLFAKNGLDAQVIRATSTVSVMGLLSGDLSIIEVAAPTVVRSNLQGSDLVFVAAGGRCVPLALSRQLVGDPLFGGRGYRYCGSVVAPLDHLPFDQRTAIVLREIDGLSYEEIAYSLGVAVGTVKSRLMRARKRVPPIDAVGVLYSSSDPATHRDRVLRYEAAMQKVAADNPKDIEVRILYALATTQSQLPADKTYSKLLAAAKILDPLFKQMPTHPGLAHYIIHAYDVPPLAERALTAARRYASLAPAAPHALHMPSHIFTRLGLWQEAIDSNRASKAAADAWVHKIDPAATAAEALHAMDYLTYAYLQMGRDQDAKAVAEEASTVTKVLPEIFSGGYALTAIPARIALETRNWDVAAALELKPASVAWNKFPYAEANLHFARALGAVVATERPAGRPGGGCRIEPSGMRISTASNRPSFFGMVGSTSEASCAMA